MPPVAAKILRLAAATLGLLAIAALGVGLWFRSHLRSSLPASRAKPPCPASPRR
jgi:hypothetical protein